MKKLSILALACAAIFSACGNDVATTGKLTINIAGLPSGSTPSVAVTGPASFSQTLTATTTLENLVPGGYTITPAKVTVATDSYSAANGTASVLAGQTSSSDVTYSKAPPVNTDLVFADFTGGSPTQTTQGGNFVNYKYAGRNSATSNPASSTAATPVKTATSLSLDYSLAPGVNSDPNDKGYAGVALGVDANSTGPNDKDGKPTSAPVNLSGYSKIKIKLARSGAGALNIKLVGPDLTVQNEGCYPSYQGAPLNANGFNDGGYAVSATLTEYTLNLSDFNFREYCAGKPATSKKTIAETLPGVIRIEIEDRFFGAALENRTMTIGSITFVK
jgi:hypothetical protein